MMRAIGWESGLSCHLVYIRDLVSSPDGDIKEVYQYISPATTEPSSLGYNDN